MKAHIQNCPRQCVRQRKHRPDFPAETSGIQQVGGGAGDWSSALPRFRSRKGADPTPPTQCVQGSAVERSSRSRAGKTHSLRPTPLFRRLFPRCSAACIGELACFGSIISDLGQSSYVGGCFVRELVWAHVHTHTQTHIQHTHNLLILKVR